jgi:hypothetical protein
VSISRPGKCGFRSTNGANPRAWMHPSGRIGDVLHIFRRIGDVLHIFIFEKNLLI